MDKICFMTPVIFQTEGSTTHIIEVWKKMPRKLNAEVHMLIIEGQNDDLYSENKFTIY